MNWFIKLIKFGLVGCVGMALDFGTTYIVKEKLKINKYIANTCGFSVAVVNNFLLDKFWTFNSSSNYPWKWELLKFVIFSVIGLAINTALLYTFNERLGVKFYLAKAMSIVCVFFWNFFTNLLFNFH